ncbi:MAG: glycosyltransferase family 2 protein [Actinomycetota bacterium]
MKRDPRLVASVLVPTYRRPALLRECVTAVLGQLEEGDEIVVCDDDSGDDTISVLESFNDPRLTWVSQPNGGCGAARNGAIRASRNELLVFVDDDEPPRPGWLKAHRDLHDPERRMMVMGRRELLVPRRGRSEVIPSHIPTLEGPIANEGSFSLRRQVLLEVGLFRDGMRRGEDIELFWRLRRAGVVFVLARDAVTRHSIDRSFDVFYKERVNGGKASAELRRVHGIGLFPAVDSMRLVDRLLARSAMRSERAGQLLARVLWIGVRSAGWLGSWRVQSVLAGRISLMLGAAWERRSLDLDPPG